ncbi:hypothetical protein BH09MYX1_BH09MYX1_42770 [soil metagenome]
MNRAAVALGLVLAIAASSGCKGSAGVDAGALVRPPSVAGATKITLHAVSDSGDHPSDLVIELTPDATGFSYVAKLTDRANALGEPIADPSPIDDAGASACVCAVSESCACESLRGGEVIRKSGHENGEPLERFLGELGKADYSATPLEPLTPGVRAHVVVTIPTGPPIHLRHDAAERPWMVDGKSVDHQAFVDAAWTRLLDSMGARGWLAALSPLPVAVAPRAYSDLAKSDLVEIDDARSADPIWSVQLRLERKGQNFAWRGKLSHRANALGTSAPDRFWAPPRPTCFCAVDETCACETDATPDQRSGTVPATVVEAFLGNLAKRELGAAVVGALLAREPSTADSHVVVWPPAGAPPIHLAAVDPSRTWGVNGRVLASDPTKGDPAAAVVKEHVSANVAYKALLDAIGVERWAAGKP